MRENLILLILLFNLSVLSHERTFAQWQKTDLQYDGPITDIAINGTEVIAATSGGFFRQINNSFWLQILSGLEVGFHNTVAVLDGEIFAGIDGAILKSSDNGFSWTKVDSTFIVRDILVHGSDIFVVSMGALYVSHDHGIAWNLINTGIPIFMDYITICDKYNNIYVGTLGQGVIVSSDNGNTWSISNSGLTNLNVLSITANESYLFAGTQGGGVFLSTDNGFSWTSVNTGLSTLNVGYMWSFESDVFAGTIQGGLFETMNNGTSWVEINEDLPPQTTPYSMIFCDPEIFLGLNEGLYYRPNWEIIGISEEHNIEQFTIYPNPAGESISIRFNNMAKEETYSIFNHEGTLMLEGNLIESSTNQVKLVGFKPGLYLIKIFNGKEVISKKLVKR
ncbi:MAG: T9SS type A sorting domain-containing protein [Bacteroidota bacterium]